MTTTNVHSVRTAILRRCCNTETLDPATIDPAHFDGVNVSVVADICRAGNLRVMQYVHRAPAGVGFSQVVTFTLCDLVGLPQYTVRWKAGMWRISHVSQRSLKSRGKNRHFIESNNDKYIVNAFKKMRAATANSNYGVAQLQVIISERLAYGAASMRKNKFLAQNVTLDVNAMSQLIAILNGTVSPASLDHETRAEIDRAGRLSQTIVDQRANIDKQFAETFVDKKFCAVFHLREFNWYVTMPVAVNPRLTTLNDFERADALQRVSQTGGVRLFMSYDALAKALPDLDFQLAMMRSARANDVNIARDPTNHDVLGETFADNVDTSLNVYRFAFGNGAYDMSSSQVTIVEMV